MKRILVVGGGGREHAIVWKLRQSQQVSEIYCAPGNAGIAGIAECLPIKVNEMDEMVKAALDLRIDLVIVAPDDPLAAGMVDIMTAAGLRAFGPTKSAARLESSKVFSKGLMRKYGIPTAGYKTFTDYEKAIVYLKTSEYPIFIKADGLALGKGAVMAAGFDEAADIVEDMMKGDSYGVSGRNVVIEEYMTGPEVTVLAFADGKSVKPMVSSQDHKRALDDDMGLNTGGMGAIAPSLHYDKDMAERCMRTIFKPTMNALHSEGIEFKGVIYFQLMLTPTGPKVIEYNARFGDPEAQAVLPLLKTDLCEIFESIIDGDLEKMNIEWSGQSSACVVMASGGYPAKYATGFEICGMSDAEKTGAIIFHAGTRMENGAYVTSGGRVLGVTAVSDSLESALAKSYEAVKMIDFQDAHYRKDIGRH